MIFYELLGMLGTILGIVSSILAYYTFINPTVRLKHYLKDTEGWEKFYFVRGKYVWHYKKHPEFVIVEGEDIINNYTTQEPWMKKYLSPLKSSSAVEAKVNGQTMIFEEFINMDNGMIFIPLPKKKEGIDRRVSSSDYYFTEQQADMARIISKSPNYRPFDKVVDEHKISIINENTGMKNIIKENWLGLSIIILIVAGIGLFYWYEWRPSQIKKKCNFSALESEGKAFTQKGVYDSAYDRCLRGQGL